MASFSSDRWSLSGVSRRRLLLAGAAGSLVLVSGVVPVFAAGKKPKVGLVMKSLANEFFKQMQAGAEKYAEENKDKFDFKAVGMKDERDFASQVDAVENNLPGSRLLESRQHTQQGRLTAARCAQQGKDFAFINREVNVIDRMLTVEGFGQVTDFQQRG